MSLDQIQTIILIIYIALTMLLMGMQLTWTEVKSLAGHRTLIAKSVVVNMLIIPTVAVAMIRFFDMSETFALGFFVVAAAPAAPFAPKFAERVKGPVHIAVGLMFTLALLSVITTPVTITLFLLSESDAFVVFPPIFFMLVMVQSLPLVIGVGVNTKWTALVDRAKGPLGTVSSLLALVVVVLLLLTNWGTLSEVTFLMITGVFILIIAALAFGWLLGGPMLITRRVLAFTSSARNVAVALLITATTFPQIEADSSIILYALIMIVVDILLVAYWQKSERFKA